MNIIRKLNVDSSFYLFMLVGMLCGYIKDMVIVFCIVLIHELGHVIFFSLFKIDIEKIVIYPFGGMCYVNKKINNRILYDFFINVGGIAMQLILFIFVYSLWKNGFMVNSTYNLFCQYNLSILLFNLLPIIPLDGNKVLVNVLCNFFSFRFSYVIGIIVSILFSLLFIIYNVICGINDLVICLFLLFQLISVIKNYRFLINKFYLERIIYDNYYNEIINGNINVKNMKIGKYYYFYKNGRYYNEKEYLKVSKIL